jgi:hypothetical protein
VKNVRRASKARNVLRANVVTNGRPGVGVPGLVGVNAGAKVAGHHVMMSRGAENVRSDRGVSRRGRGTAISSVKSD